MGCTIQALSDILVIVTWLASLHRVLPVVKVLDDIIIPVPLWLSIGMPAYEQRLAATTTWHACHACSTVSGLLNCRIETHLGAIRQYLSGEYAIICDGLEKPLCSMAMSEIRALAEADTATASLRQICIRSGGQVHGQYYVSIVSSGEFGG